MDCALDSIHILRRGSDLEIGYLRDFGPPNADRAGHQIEALPHHFTIRYPGAVADFEPDFGRGDRQPGVRENFRDAAGQPVSKTQDAPKDQRSSP